MTATPATRRVVHGVGTSRTIRAHWALAELALAYETVPVRTRTPDTESAAFRALNPRGKVPVLVDDELVVAESAAIVTYLGERYVDGPLKLLPERTVERARYHEWVSFICMELDATALYVMRRHADLAGIYGEAPAAVSSASEYFARMIGAAAELWTGTRDTLLPGGFSGVDILMTTCLDWAVRYHQPLPERLAEYRHTMHQRPGYLTAVEANQVP